MKITKYLALILLITGGQNLMAKDYLLSTNKTSLLVTADTGKKPQIQYYGSLIQERDISSLRVAGLTLHEDSYPVFGIHSMGEKAMIVTHADGNMSLDLTTESVKEYDKEDGRIIEIGMKDKVYPFILKQFFKAYKNTDVISTWIEVTNLSKKEIILQKFASAVFPISRHENWISHFHGSWASENMMEEELLTNGKKIITNNDGVRNAQTDSPTLMVTTDGKPSEEKGNVIGSTLEWSGNYKMELTATNKQLYLTAGISEEASTYHLDKKETFVTPELALTYSTEGKGGVSRAFHRWARAYKLHGGNQLRDILLNSWEGVYFDVNQKGMEEMMENFSAMGGELFVMDDGWFGNKYPRNRDKSSLGDWEVCKEKLPLGIQGLLDAADKNHIKFGIWIEPEMANTVSELYEKHPEWVLSQDNRPVSTSRGGTQVVLDLCNPAVQDFAFNIIDNLMTQFPNIAYMKWDSNSRLMNYGSHYLPANKQSHIYIEYHKGLNKVLERVRAKYPDLVIQACGGGGGRVNYGVLPYFDEFWPSDNTDAIQRIYMQWGVSHFYPAISMASHVSANKNHQTGRIVPLKFRFDVAMTGRLGMEIQPKDMSTDEKTFARKAISAYKTIRPIVQFGDLYRLLSPYENKGVASLMYANETKDHAVFYAYKLQHMKNMRMPLIKLTGLCPNKCYTIKDLTPDGKPCPLNGKVIPGYILINEGLKADMLLKKEYSSVALELTAQ